MSYQVFAIKTRPQSFDQVIGQEPVVTALKHALDQNKLHHAYLFTGTRGVGKTTLARIIAKAMNCEQGISANPCNQCDICQSIMQGKFPDLIEIDAASKTKVEDTRALLDTVIYAPTRGKYKIYLIDEVHMLSTHSFNALLKTLEEPPSHVKFLLATTDPHKIPATILSRCLQFTLKWVDAAVIAQHLQNILTQDNIKFEPTALQLLASAAEGSVRDSLSLLEQAVAIGAGSVTAEQVRSMLGRIKGIEIINLLNCLVSNNSVDMLTQLKNLAAQGADFTVILSQLIYALHQMAILQQAPDLIQDYSAETLPELQILAQKIKPQDLQVYYQIALLAKRDLPYSPQPRLALEMALLRMLAFIPVAGEKQVGGNTSFTHSAPSPVTTARSASTLTSTPAVATASAVQNSRQAQQPVSSKPVATEVQPARPAEIKQADAAVQVKHSGVNNNREMIAEITAQNWHLILTKFNLNGIQLQILKNSAFISCSDNKLCLNVDPKFNALVNNKRIEEIEQSIKEYLQKDMKVMINAQVPASSSSAEGSQEPNTPANKEHHQREQRFNNLVANFKDDPNIKEIIKTFNGELKLDSVELAED